MVGNDVVDLADVDADAATYSPRWLRRVCTPRERHDVEVAADPHRMRWRIWAAKEAAYKCVTQDDPATVFAPRAFEARWDDGAMCTGAGHRCGHVEWRGRRLPLFLEEGPEYVHAWVDAGEDRRESVRSGLDVLPEALRSTPEGPSIQVRRCVLRDATPLLGPAAGRLRVVRTGRIPRICAGPVRVSESLSLSHHGRFVAFVWRPVPAMALGDAVSPPPDRDMHGALA